MASDDVHNEQTEDDIKTEMVAHAIGQIERGDNDFMDADEFRRSTMANQAKQVETAIVAAEPGGELRVVETPPSIETIIQIAVQAGRTGTELKELLDVYERMQTVRAEMAFNEAFAAFQADCPTIPKSRTAKVVSDSGGGFTYGYASLDEIDPIVMPVLTNHGLSRAFGDMLADGNNLTETCRLLHVAGHWRERKVTVPIGTRTKLSDQQKLSAASTLARRLAFVGVAGLKVCDPDDDAAAEPSPPISAGQFEMLDAKIKVVKADMEKFLAYYQIQKLTELPSDRFDHAMDMLERKGQRGGSLPP